MPNEIVIESKEDIYRESYKAWLEELELKWSVFPWKLTKAFREYRSKQPLCGGDCGGLYETSYKARIDLEKKIAEFKAKELAELEKRTAFPVGDAIASIDAGVDDYGNE